MRGMGIAKQSLYDTFGDKRALYLKALAYYREEQNGALRRMFESQPSVKKGFAKLLYGLSAESRERHERGCLLLSANLERDTADAVVAEFLRENQAEVEAIFVEAAFAERRKEGESAAEAGSGGIEPLFRGHDSRDAGDGQSSKSDRKRAHWSRWRAWRSRCSIDLGGIFLDSRTLSCRGQTDSVSANDQMRGAGPPLPKCGRDERLRRGASGRRLLSRAVRRMLPGLGNFGPF